MKRWTMRISLCLLLGVVTTVAVAWGLATRGVAILDRSRVGYHISYDHDDVEVRGDRHLWTLENRWLGFVRVRVWVESSDERRRRESLTRNNASLSGIQPLPKYHSEEFWVERAGCPREAFIRTGTYFDDGPPPPVSDFDSWDPVSSAVAADTVLFAAIWFVLFFIPGPFKRWNRRRRGLCPKCRYDLRGNPEGVTGCAECGWGRETME